MPVLILLLSGTLYWVSLPTRAVLEALVACDGVFGRARFFAARLGFRDRHHLARVLAREGLPPLEELAAWIRLARWVLHWERDGTALSELALAEGADPAVWYRTVMRLTGAKWSDVRARGLAWVLDQLRNQCRIPSEHAAAGTVARFTRG